ncbi:hypothetical protein [Pseudonocardia charpentierae]|uniref:Uncharacterized protein n=1 Tax=Pseudonocardia charpentierae TaxID=3075545 RepID=A0ABU2NI24_9PSEU|nr:hypothetical protein [Pseudonocardia sp. DSM 45834]MDT0353606.1 hypothetical protein [Pseudonocardia sp. DSM 45834]
MTAGTADDDDVWIARLTPVDGDVAALLTKPLGLDVWERGSDHLVVMATELQLAELERRRLAQVDRLSTRNQYISRMQPDTAREDD